MLQLQVDVLQTTKGEELAVCEDEELGHALGRIGEVPEGRKVSEQPLLPSIPVVPMPIQEEPAVAGRETMKAGEGGRGREVARLPGQAVAMAGGEGRALGDVLELQLEEG